MRTSQRTGVSTFASRTSPRTDQSLQKKRASTFPTQTKFNYNKISSPSENKKHLRHLSWLIPKLPKN
jgi:hypothetical protein